MKYTKYQPQSSSNPINIGLAVITCIVLATLLGWLYNLTFLIPIIYLNFLITIGFGFVLAITLQIISKLFKIKEKRTRVYLIIFTLIIAYYSHWIVFILTLHFGSVPNLVESLNYWIYPRDFFYNISQINKYGSWSFGFSNTLVNGITLTLIWIVEALIIFFIAIQYIYKFPENPFSEKSNKWYSKLILDYNFNSVYSEEKFINSLKEKGIDLILNMEKGLAYKYADISVFFLEKENIQYLSIDNIYIEVKNKSKKSITPVIPPIKINNEEANALISKFGTKKEFFLDF